MQSQINEPTVTKDSTINGPFVDILIYSQKENFEGFFLQLFVFNMYNAHNNLHYFINSFLINMNFLKVYKYC